MEENAPLGIKRHNFCAAKWGLISVRVGQCEENLIFRLFCGYVAIRDKISQYVLSLSVPSTGDKGSELQFKPK